MHNFDVYVKRVLKHEGGYVDHPSDPGGKTNLGITLRTLERAMRDMVVNSRLQPVEFIRHLNPVDAAKIYERYYFAEPQINRLPPVLDFQVFDAAVNHGAGNAIRWLQRAVNVADDGRLGPVTIAAVKAATATPAAMSAVVAKFWVERVRFYTKLSTFGTFGKGWMNRMVDNMHYFSEDI